KVKHRRFFDTVRVDGSAGDVAGWVKAAAEQRINLRRLADTAITIALDETKTEAGLRTLWKVLTGKTPSLAAARKGFDAPGAGSERQSAYLTHLVFNTHHSETEMLRYMRRLEARDLSLTHSMIPLGSCTMKLNATVEMMPVTWPEWGRLHPF